MKNTLLIRFTVLTIAFLLTSIITHAQYYSVNFDYKTIGAMVGTYAEEAGTEAMVHQNTSDIAESYGYSEVATAGIFASKLLDRNALKSSKGFGNPDENFYYKKAYRLVANKIIPRTISVTKKLIKEPSTSIYWGTHLLRVMADTKSLCNQFSALCSNSSLSFSDIPFVEFTVTLQNIFDLQQVGNFKTIFDDISNIGSNFSEDNIDSELDKRNLKSTVTFKATVSISRRPKYFLGIKIHRAIVQISWELLAEYNDESVIEIMQLDPNSNQEEQTSKVNQRLSELQRQYPDCDVSVDYEYASGQEPEEDDNYEEE